MPPVTRQSTRDKTSRSVSASQRRQETGSKSRSSAKKNSESTDGVADDSRNSGQTSQATQKTEVVSQGGSQDDQPMDHDPQSQNQQDKTEADSNSNGANNSSNRKHKLQDVDCTGDTKRVKPDSTQVRKNLNSDYTQGELIQAEADFMLSQRIAGSYLPSSVAIDNRRFIHNAFSTQGKTDGTFSVVCYNILAQCHIDRVSSSQPAGQYLHQDHRHKLLKKELDFLDADVVCLQEVEPEYYQGRLLPAMTRRGYTGYYIKRIHENEGEATFVRDAKFKVTSRQVVSLNDLTFKEVDMLDREEDLKLALEMYLDRADVMLVTHLRSKLTGRTVSVCNIQVASDLNSPDVTCVQVACAIKHLVSTLGSCSDAHVICGGLNSTETSPVYQLAKDGYLSDEHIRALQKLSNLQLVDGTRDSLVNQMWNVFQHTASDLRSVYQEVLGNEPALTCFTKRSGETLDYILYSAGSLEAVGVLETLDPRVVAATNGLPSARIPSDHLSLKAVFRLRDDITE